MFRELEQMLEKAVVAYFTAVHQHLPGFTAESHNKPKSE
jgi:hypothetical protein